VKYHYGKAALVGFVQLIFVNNVILHNWIHELQCFSSHS